MLQSLLSLQIQVSNDVRSLVCHIAFIFQDFKVVYMCNVTPYIVLILETSTIWVSIVFNVVQFGPFYDYLKKVSTTVRKFHSYYAPNTSSGGNNF